MSTEGGSLRTGHSERMDRDTLKQGAGHFGSVEYAREELRAEMSAMMTGERVGVGHDGSRGAAYVKGWLKALEQDPKEIYKARGPRQGFFEHADSEAVRRHLPPACQDVLDFAYYSGWRKREILELRWSEVDEGGGVVRLSPERSKTRVGRVLPIVPPIAAVLARRRAQRQGEDPVVFRRDAVTVRAWRTAWPEACRRAGVPGRLLHDCRRTAARNLVRAGVPERVAMQLTGHRSRVLQRAVAMVLESVYEQDFLDCSFGFRPGRSAHQALQVLWDKTMAMRGGWVVDLDIQGFFDALDHQHLRDFLDQRVRDGVLRRAIDKWLKAGVLEEGRLRRSVLGTPQGGVVSPLLANIYLHHVLDVWFTTEVQPRLRGKSVLVRYADDVGHHHRAGIRRPPSARRAAETPGALRSHGAPGGESSRPLPPTDIWLAARAG